ncbi:MAG: GNAT family N-acetyltransferase [Desulfohalobiaceae bacterium]|nr:GNAT family N-acetyltransferase [Desulfohalobiaceae bacterium]
MIGYRLVESTNSRDLELVQELAREIWGEHYTPIIGSEQVEYMLRNFQSASAIAEQIRDGYVYYLLLSHGVPGGYLSYVKQPDKEGLQLSKLYVHRDQRGQGLGRHGLELVQEDCLQLGLDLIWLTVNKYNSDSIAWYRHMGFEYAGSQVADIGGGFVMDDYILEKRLPSHGAE